MPHRDLLQDDEPQSYQAFHIFSCSHTNEEVPAFSQVYLAAVFDRDNKHSLTRSDLKRNQWHI